MHFTDMKKSLLLAAFLMAGTFALRAQSGTQPVAQSGTQDFSTLESTMKGGICYPLYPNGAPDSNGLEGKEDWSVIRKQLSGVGTAKIYVYLPAGAPAGKGPARKAVVICPGGGYIRESMLSEGDMVARWLAARGIVGVVLQYRLPNGHAQIPLEDLHAAIRMVRERAKEWNVDPKKVGVIGFSAGGHLAVMGAVNFDKKSRPDFVAAIYAVVSLSDQSRGSGLSTVMLGPPPAANAPQAELDRYDSLAREYSAQRHVTPQTPPMFLALSDDDHTVPPINSTAFYNALKAANVPAELHIWPKGGHGWGWREDFPYRDEFLTAYGRWLDER